MPTAKSQSVESVRQTLRDAIKESLKIFTPPERITVSEWADRYRSLSKEETSRPGMWDTSSVPYMKKIMDCFSEETIREIVFLKSTQIGGSEALIKSEPHTRDLSRELGEQIVSVYRNVYVDTDEKKSVQDSI